MAPRSAKPESGATLDKLARSTGARFYPITHAADLDQAYGRIAEILRAQYLITYYPHQRPGHGGWRGVEVTVGDRKVTVRTAPGYFVDPR